MNAANTSRTSRTKAQSASGAQTAAAEDAGVRVLKKYPNRRLYDTAGSSYITLAEVKEFVMQGTEAGGSPIFSEAVLSNIIRFYGHAMQGFFGANLENSIQAFTDMHKKMMERAPGFGMENWQKMMQDMTHSYTAQSGQLLQQMQEQAQHQYQAGMQQWLKAFQPKR